MSAPSQRLAELGLTLPPVVTPLAAYVPARRSGNHVYVSGQVPVVEGDMVATGKVGAEVSVETAREAARVCALNGVAAAADLLGGIDAIAGVVKAVIFVASTPEFTSQPQVGNGASELLGEIFGEAGAHARSAVGVTALPLNVPVEVELIFEVA